MCDSKPAEREAFEAFQRKYHFGVKVRGDGDWERLLPSLRRSARWENDWRMWQAATAASQARVREATRLVGVVRDRIKGCGSVLQGLDEIEAALRRLEGEGE
jgi:hypothetical protein